MEKSIKIKKKILNEYRECTEEIAIREHVHSDISERLIKEKDSLPYSQYMELLEEKKKIEEIIAKRTNELKVWDKAIGICLETIYSGRNIDE